MFICLNPRKSKIEQRIRVENPSIPETEKRNYKPFNKLSFLTRTSTGNQADSSSASSLARVTTAPQTVESETHIGISSSFGINLFRLVADASRGRGSDKHLLPSRGFQTTNFIRKEPKEIPYFLSPFLDYLGSLETSSLETPSLITYSQSYPLNPVVHVLFPRSEPAQFHRVMMEHV